MKREELVKAIGNTLNVIVTFTKKNGEERVMKCTRNWEVAKKSENFKQPAEKTEPVEYGENDRVIVWDVEKDAFRSIIPSSVISVKA